MAHMKRGYIPSEPIRKIVKKYIDNRDMGTVEHRCSENYSPRIAIAEELGTSERSLRAFVNGHRYGEEMPFDMADSWLCVIRSQESHPWLPELAEVYYGADLNNMPTEEEREARRESNRKWEREDRRKRNLEWEQRRAEFRVPSAT